MANQTAFLLARFSLAQGALFLLSQLALPLAHAELPPHAVLVFSPVTLPLTAAERALDLARGSVIDLERFQVERSRTVSAAQLERMHTVDLAVVRAKAALAALDEVQALRELAHAESALLQTLSLPGATVFYAEIELQLGVCAAQLGQDGLASAAFMRSARVDPSRRLLAGEAAPDVVALANRAFARASVAPEGEVRIVANVTGAQLFVDDVPLGASPRIVRARAGMHVLRVEAPGFAAYASLFEIVEGVRPDQHVVLSELAATRALAQLERAWMPSASTAAHTASADTAAQEISAATRELFAVAPELEGVALSERAALGQRGAFILCTRQGCGAPVLAPRAHMPNLSTSRLRPEQALSNANLQAARAWLRSESEPNAATPTRMPLHAAADEHRDGRAASSWRSWLAWSAGSAAVVGAAIAIGVAAWPDAVRTQRLTVDPSGLR